MATDSTRNSSKPAAEWIWLDGELKAWADATLHVCDHVVHYGSSVFEGIRAYEVPSSAWASGSPAILCLEEHLDRLWNSTKVYRMTIPFSRQVIHDAVLETIRANNLGSCYIRPVVWRGGFTFNVDGRRCSTHASIITVPMGKYLGPDALEKGVDVGVSTWQRMAPNTYPANAKIGGQYINSQFIAMEAADRGFVEGIALDSSGHVSEGSGENIFALHRGHLLTPPLSSSILDGITRRCVITLAEELGVSVREEPLPRELLYVADELFFTGTAAEITPIRSVDGVQIGGGQRGPLTTSLMTAFFDIVEGRVSDRHGWLTPVAS